MKVTYFGCRGSLPAPGPGTLKYGGNTTCLLVETEKATLIVDAGSGLRNLGNALLGKAFGKGKGVASFFFTHVHWDHIHGFPFFVPGYITGNRFEFYGIDSMGYSLEQVLSLQQQFQTFPVMFEEMPADMHFNTIEEDQTIEVEDILVRARRLNHPGGVLAYRIEADGKTLTFATDVEHYSILDDRLVELAQGSDLLVYDSQFTPKEYESHIGWGHSTYEEAVKIAKAAGVKELHLTHHDPDHDDAFLELKILAPAKKLFDSVSLAREGWTFKL